MRAANLVRICERSFDNNFDSGFPTVFDFIFTGTSGLLFLSLSIWQILISFFIPGPFRHQGCIQNSDFSYRFKDSHHFFFSLEDFHRKPKSAQGQTGLYYCKFHEVFRFKIVSIRQFRRAVFCFKLQTRF